MFDRNSIFFYQTGFLGLCGDKVDAIDYYTAEIDKLSKEVSETFCPFGFIMLSMILLYNF